MKRQASLNCAGICMVKEKTMSLKISQIARTRTSKVDGRPFKVGLIIILTSMVFIYGLIEAIASNESSSPVAVDSSIVFAFQTEKKVDRRDHKLEAGSVIERDINGSETHNYSFDLDAGMSVRIVVDQRLGDVRIKLLNMQGEKVHEADRAGLVSLSAISDGATTYRISVESLQRAGVTGRYMLKLDNLHAARAEDRQRLMAEKLVNEGLSTGKSRKQADVKEAIIRLTKAAHIWEKLGDSRELSATLYFLAQRHEDLGDYDEARKADEKALELSRQNSDQIRESLVLGHLGNLAIRIEDDEQALDYFERAAGVSRAAGKLNLEQIHLANSGVIAKRKRDYGKARIIYLQALKGAREMGDESVEASILNNLARVYDLSGEKQKAIETYEEILPIWRRLESSDNESATLKNLGAVYESMGQNEPALQHYKFALEKGRHLGNPNREAHILADLARVHRALGMRDQARIDIEQALAIFESLRARLANPTHRAMFAASSRKYTDLILDLLIQDKNQKTATLNQNKAFEFSERAHARSLQEMLLTAGIDFRQDADQKLLDRETQLKKQIQSMDTQRLQLLARKDGAAKAAEVEKELGNLYSQYENLVSDMRKSNPQLANLTQFQPVRIDELQKNLISDRAVLLEYYLGDEQSYLMAMSPDSLTSFVLPPRETIEKLANKLYDAMSAPGQKIRFETPQERVDRMAKAERDFNLASSELSRILIAPVRDQLGDKTLLIVPDGVLQYVPFAALPDPRAGSITPLIVHNEIVNLPSAAAFLTLRRNYRPLPDTGRSIAVMADPVFSREDSRFEQLTATAVSGNIDETAVDIMQNIMTRGSGHGLKLPRLRYSRNEATSIASMSGLKSSMVALDFKANLDLIKSVEMSRYGYLHIATHGLMNSEVPALSGLVLSLVDENGQSRDGVLKLDDIYNLKLNAELVVLSACQTALGKEIKGEGVIGLTRGFMYAGARRVVSSLWMVDDAATAEMMKVFYEGMLKKNLKPASALRAAQIAMLKKDNWDAPYFWAGFILQGESR